MHKHIDTVNMNPACFIFLSIRFIKSIPFKSNKSY